jgi:hypothetical protein
LRTRTTSFGAAVLLAVLAPDLSHDWLSLAVLFLLAPMAILLPLAVASSPPDASLSLRSALAFSILGLALNFSICVAIFAWKIGRTTFDPMTYSIFELEWMVKAVLLAVVFLVVRLIGKFILRRRTIMSASSGP